MSKKMKRFVAYAVGAAIAICGAFVFLTFSGRPSGQVQSASVGKETPKKIAEVKRSVVVGHSETAKAGVSGSLKKLVDTVSSSHPVVAAPVTAGGQGNGNPPNLPPTTTSANGSWPLPQNGRFAGHVVAYRSSELQPKEKGGEPGELREWLIEPSEGRVRHLEEEYVPDANGELALAATHCYVADKVFLKLDGDRSYDEFRREMLKRGAESVTRLPGLPKGGSIVSVVAPEATFDAVAELNDAVIAYDGSLVPERDEVTTVNRVPNDPKYSSLWGMQKIDAPTAWNNITDSSSILVAVCDTGIRYDHQDLSGSMWRNPNPGSAISELFGISGATDDTYGVKIIDSSLSTNPMDDYGHGSHCAGTIGGTGNNSVGVAGVAWKAKLMAVKVFDSQGSGTRLDTLYGWLYAAQNGAKVISCSYSFSYASDAEVEVLDALRANGVIVVCASGNDTANVDTTPRYPACNPHANVISVAATRSTDALCSFSNYGATSVDIAAPGEGIWSCVCSSTSAYDSYAGTSMATPHVAGAVALVWARYPSYTYSQVIQKIYSAADAVSLLSGKVAGSRRLNVGKAIGDPAPAAPVVSASDGAYSDKVQVTWSAVSGATHYKVFRATTSTGTGTALTGWITGTSYNDASAAAGTTYWYYGQAAKSSSGANASSNGARDSGWKSATSQRDSWDPGDDTASGGTTLTPGSSVSSHGTHTLNANDPYDWFKISMTSGTTYSFETTGTSDTYGELFNSSSSTNSSSRVAYNDDGGTNYNFKITYTPTSSGTYYLRVRCYSTSTAGSYTLKYSATGRRDSWDPSDDTYSGATQLTVGTSEGSHGTHYLSAGDNYDWFKMTLTAGRTYVFRATGTSGDTYGELYSSPSSSPIAYNDDGGDSSSGSTLNFKIQYTVTATGTYYLRVRCYSTGSSATYTLKYSQIEAGQSLDMLYTNYNNVHQGLNWPVNGFLTVGEDSVAPRTEFAPGEEILFKWAYNEATYIGFTKVFTNRVEVLDANNAVIANGQFPKTGMEEGTWTSNITTLPDLDPGAYKVRVELNRNLGGVRAFTETNYVNNVLEVPFTVRSAKTLTGISISGNTNIVSKGEASYVCYANYSDGTRNTVNPTWTITSGGSYATVSSAGVVTAEDIGTTARSVTLQASYNSKTASKVIRITPTTPGQTPGPDTPDDSEIANPFDSPVQYPTQPMVVEAIVRISGATAEAGDYLAAFCGTESRGYAAIAANGRATMAVFVNESNEQISFKVFDRSAGDSGEILNCTQTVPGRAGSFQGSASEPMYIDAVVGNDPWGTPVMTPGSPSVIEAKVTIDGDPAQTGDILAAFDGETLVGKQVLRYRAGFDAAGGEAYCTLSMFLGGTKTLTFKVYDMSEDEIRDCITTFSVCAGDIIGSDANRRLIEARVAVPEQTLTLERAGWNLVSFSVLPQSAAASSVFAPVSSAIDYVIAGTDIWTPSGGQSLNVRIGSGYWIHTTRDNVSWTFEGATAPETTISLVSGWNLIGYTLPRGGAIVDVLRSALATGKINYVVSGASIYPGGNLTTMAPGSGYWVNASGAVNITFDQSGMMSSKAVCAEISSQNNFGPFGDGSDLSKDAVTPVILKEATFTLFGKPAAIGDCVCAYRADTGAKCAVARIEDETGVVTIPLMVNEGVSVHFKVWSSASGTETPAIYDCAAENDFTVPTGGSELPGKVFTVTGTSPAFTVTFDLDGHGMRTGGGELVQQVAFGDSAVEPVVVGEAGCSFLFWDNLTTDVRADRIIKAVWDVAEVPEPEKFTAGGTYDGWMTDANGQVCGIVQVKTGKFSGGKSKITATVTPTVTAKENFSASVTEFADKYVLGNGKKNDNYREIELSIGPDEFTGSYGDCKLTGARNRFSIADDPMAKALESYKGKNWTLTFTGVEGSATHLRVNIGNKGAAKVTGSLPDGTKVSYSGQLVLSESGAYVAVNCPLYSKKGGISFLVSLGADGTAEVRHGLSWAEVKNRQVTGVHALTLSDAGFTSRPVVQEYVPSANNMLGVEFEAKVLLSDRGYPAKFSAQGLPAGLKIDSGTGVISGVPTKEDSKSVTIKIVGEADKNWSVTYPINIVISPMKPGIVGNYNGTVFGWQTQLTEGKGTLSISSQCKISGKLQMEGGTNWTLSAKSFAKSSQDYTDLGMGYFLNATLEAKSGKLVRELDMSVFALPADDNGVYNSVIYIQDTDETHAEWGADYPYCEVFRSVWKDTGAPVVLDNYIGLYTMALQTASGATGYASVQIDKNGNAKFAGKLADGTAISGSYPLLYKGLGLNTGNLDLEIGFFAAPSTYKGGIVYDEPCLYVDDKGVQRIGGWLYLNESYVTSTYVGFAKNRNPQASGEYGKVVSTEFSSYGAWYNKQAALADYYSKLAIATDYSLLNPSLDGTVKTKDYDPADPKKKRTVVDSQPYEASAVDLSAQLSELMIALNGQGTAYVLPKTSKPRQDPVTKEWMYGVDGNNDSAFTYSYNKATGIYKGSFTCWYDYVSEIDNTKGTEKSTHASKKVSYEGVAIQGNRYMPGFYLWEKTGHYEVRGMDKTYKYKLSCPMIFDSAPSDSEN